MGRAPVNLTVIAVFALSVALASSGHALAGGVIGIASIPPSFNNIELTMTGESRNSINLTVTDLNGEDRIFRIIVTFADADGGEVANFSYSQYAVFDNGSIDFNEKIDTFDESVGKNLVADECVVEYVSTGNVYVDETMRSLRVFFSFKPVDAETVKITCIDTDGEIAVYEGTLTYGMGDAVTCLAGYAGLVLMAVCPMTFLAVRRRHG